MSSLEDLNPVVVNKLMVASDTPQVGGDVLVVGDYAVSLSKVNSVIPTTGLIFNCPLKNYSPNAQSGQVLNQIGAPLFDEIQGLKCVSLNGSSAIKTQDSASTVLAGLGSSFSYCGWFYLDQISNFTVISCTEAGGFNFHLYNSLIAEVNLNGTYYQVDLIAQNGLSTNKWYFFCITYDGNSLKGYLDNVLKDTTSATGNINFGSYKVPLMIGAEPGGQNGTTQEDFIYGKICGVKIYNKALTDSEINFLFNEFTETSDSQLPVISEKEAVFTFPIPYDNELQNLTLFVDISKDGRFDFELTDSDSNSYQDTTGFYKRISMGNPSHRQKMKIFSNGNFIPIPDSGINLPYYGETVVFILDKELMKGYLPGQTYYGRYRWWDLESAVPDWVGFIFTYDFHDIRPPKIKEEVFSVEPCYAVGEPDKINKTITVQRVNPIDSTTSELVGEEVTVLYDFSVPVSS